MQFSLVFLLDPCLLVFLERTKNPRERPLDYAQTIGLREHHSCLSQG